jgi:hypothetical protein
MNPKICIHCKHFKGGLRDEFGKCAKFPVVNLVDDYLVTGIIDKKKKDYYFCSNVRKYNPQCGPDGKSFEPRSPKDRD